MTERVRHHRVPDFKLCEYVGNGEWVPVVKVVKKRRQT